jgi:hypothetical protein
MLSVASLALSASDLARPGTMAATQLSSSPNIWMTDDFLSPATVQHMLSKVPKDESAYMPCIGQVQEFASKRCTFLPVEGDDLLEAAITKIEHAWDVDVTELRKGLPIIRYLPGAPPVGKHGDEDRHGSVPNATLVMYLTNPSGASAGGKTIFSDANVAVTPKQGSVLSFQNVDDAGAVHPLAKHTVSAVPADATSDRLVIQVPIAHKPGQRAHAYPEHVSGAKKPGAHESMHGNDAQKAASQAALAAGFGIAIAYMAAKAGKFDEADVPELEKQAKETGKFTEDDFKKTK